MRRRLTDDKYKILNIVNTIFFFFSSRRRHTRFDCDWSSDVCSSDLRGLLQRQGARGRRPPLHRRAPSAEGLLGHARSEERRVGKGVDRGGRRIIKKKIIKRRNTTTQ